VLVYLQPDLQLQSLLRIANLPEQYINYHAIHSIPSSSKRAVTNWSKPSTTVNILPSRFRASLVSYRTGTTNFFHSIKLTTSQAGVQGHYPTVSNGISGSRAPSRLPTSLATQTSWPPSNHFRVNSRTRPDNTASITPYHHKLTTSLFRNLPDTIPPLFSSTFTDENRPDQPQSPTRPQPSSTKST
jgi:hypothetical protein